MQNIDDTALSLRSSRRVAILTSSLLRFTAVGGIGFCVDAGVLTVLMKAGWGIIPSRSVSFLLAASVTWLMNKIWTFRGSGKRGARREYALYLAAQLVGAGINLGVFFVLIFLSPGLREFPVIPLAVGAIVSLGFNFIISKRWVFAG